jgi:formylglycine-generating enzyme required for sulfatase activity
MATRIHRRESIRIAQQRRMTWIEGGSFTMGSDRHYPEERPARVVSVSGFWIDPTPVTNREFARFVAATRYVTVAERSPATGSTLFQWPNSPARQHGTPAWWALVPGADWRHPAGPDSSIKGLDNHPVVHVAWEDVRAYAFWADLCLPSEAEWEFAARGGLEGMEFAWGNELMPCGRHRANIWLGNFPYHDHGGDGWRGTSPVGVYPPNGYDLYDMIGNVWEWTSDWWTARFDRQCRLCCSAAPTSAGQVARKVLKGGSHLCGPNHCRRYRPAARHSQPIDSGAGHIGFRCALRP